MSTDAAHELHFLRDGSPGASTETSGRPAQRHVTADGFAYSNLQDPSQGHNIMPKQAQSGSSLRSRLIERSWSLELLAWFFAAITLAILIAVLATFNNHPLSHWNSKININTVLNAMTTIASTALVCPVASSIAQLRWIWLRKKKEPIVGIKSFGSGPVDIFIMIFKHPKMLLAYLGTLNVILILLFGPITQATINLPLRQQQLDLGTGTLPIRTKYSVSNGPRRDVALPAGIRSRDGSSTFHFEGPVRQITTAIDLAMAGNQAYPSDVQAQCSRGDCTFGTYSTLGVYPTVDVLPQTDISKNCTRLYGCSYTVKELQTNPPYISGSLTVGGGESDKSAAYSLWIGSSDQVVATSAPTYSPDDYDVPDPETLAKGYVVYVADTRRYKPNSSPAKDTTIAALKLALKLCVNQYNTSVSNGTTKTESKGRTTNLKWTADASSISVNTSGQTYTVPKITMDQFRAYLANQFFIGYSSIGIQNYVTNDPLGTSSADTANVLAGLTVNRTSQDAQAGVKDKMENVAMGMTNALRMSGDQNETLSGYASEPVIYIVISFRWLIVPVLSTILALVFLLAVMVETARHGIPAWKASPIAALLALDQDASGAIAAQDHTKSVNERASEI